MYLFIIFANIIREVRDRKQWGYKTSLGSEIVVSFSSTTDVYFNPYDNTTYNNENYSRIADLDDR